MVPLAQPGQSIHPYRFLLGNVTRGCGSKTSLSVLTHILFALGQSVCSCVPKRIKPAVGTSSQHPKDHYISALNIEKVLDRISNRRVMWVGDMAQPRKVLATKSDDLSLIPRTHMVECKTQSPWIIL